MKKNNKKYDNNSQSNSNYSSNKIKNSKIILNDSDSDSECDYHKPIYPQKNKMIKNKIEEKMKSQKFLGHKHKSNFEEIIPKNKNKESDYKKKPEYNSPKSTIKLKKPSFLSDSDSNRKLGNKSTKKLKKSSLFSDSDISSSQFISNNTYKNKNNETNYYNNVIQIKEEKNDDEIVVFPYEYTENVIEALTCKVCKGIYIRPYVITQPGCMHIFCLGCILKMLEDKEIGICPKCKTQFILKNIKYSEKTDFYVKTFFPQIPKIIEENNNMLNQFMESESRKYSQSQSNEDNNKIELKCELKPYKKTNIPSRNRLPEIVNKHNKIVVGVKSEDENIISILKKQIIKRLNYNLKEEDLEIRCNDIELSSFNKYKLVKSFLYQNQYGIITFYYSKK